MSDICANFPLEGSIAIKVNDTLTLTFTEDCRPCWDHDDTGMFDHHLPRHDHRNGHVWKGLATAAGTVTSSSVPYGKDCGAEKHGPKRASARTIQVGG